MRANVVKGFISGVISGCTYLDVLYFLGNFFHLYTVLVSGK